MVLGWIQQWIGILDATLYMISIVIVDDALVLGTSIEIISQFAWSNRSTPLSIECALLKIIIISSRCTQLCNQYVPVKIFGLHIDPPKKLNAMRQRIATLSHGNNDDVNSQYRIALSQPVEPSAICPSNKLMETWWQMTATNIIGGGRRHRTRRLHWCVLFGWFDFGVCQTEMRWANGEKIREKKNIKINVKRVRMERLN